MQIDISVGQFRKRHPTIEGKFPTGKFAAKFFKSQGVIRKLESGLKISQRRQRHIIGSSNVYSHVGRAGKNRPPNRAADLHIETSVAVQLLNLRRKLPQEVY